MNWQFFLRDLAVLTGMSLEVRIHPVLTCCPPAGGTLAVFNDGSGMRGGPQPGKANLKAKIT